MLYLLILRRRQGLEALLIGGDLVTPRDVDFFLVFYLEIKQTKIQMRGGERDNLGIIFLIVPY